MQYARDTENRAQPTSIWRYSLIKPLELPTPAGRNTQHVGFLIPCHIHFPRRIHFPNLAKLLLANCRTHIRIFHASIRRLAPLCSQHKSVVLGC